MKVKYGDSYYESFRDAGVWVAQMKLNGQRNMLAIRPDGEIEFWNRHGERQKYIPPLWLIDELKETFKMEDGKWSIIDGELLHNKDKSTKNMIYVWDVLVHNGSYLIGQTAEQRYDLLHTTVGSLSEGAIVPFATEHIMVAENIPPEQWEEKWKLTATSYVEGFVLKKMSAKLDPGFREKNNGPWQIRVRKPHKCYAF